MKLLNISLPLTNISFINIVHISFQFRFASTADYFLMFVGLIFAMGQGTLVQINYLILGDVTDIFIDAITANV